MHRKVIKITSIGLAAFIALEAYGLEMVDISKSKAGAMFNRNKEISLEYDKDLLQEYKNADDSTVVEIPDFAADQIRDHLKLPEDQEITVKDLRKVTMLLLFSDDANVDLSWLNYCTNLERLVISGALANNMDSIIELDNLTYFSLYTSGVEIEKDYKKLAFLSRCPKLETLELDDDFDPKYLREIVSGIDLEINQQSYLHSIRDLDFVKNLTIRNNPYDIAIKLSTEDVAYLENKGVNIIIDHPEVSLEDFKRINKRLDDIVDSLGLDENATDEEKIDAVLIYCIENLQYSEEISKKLMDNPDKDLNFMDTGEYYEKGTLYGALEKDEQICGNYEALMEALLYRLGVDSYAMHSETHTWNLIEVDGEYYYYDATWLDEEEVTYEEMDEDSIIIGLEPSEEAIRSNDPELKKQLTWYKVKPEDYEANPEKYEEGQIGSHKAKDYQLVIERINQDKKAKNPAEEVYEVTVGGKKFVIAGGALIGLLSALGIVVAARKKQEAKKIKEGNQFFDHNSNNYGNDYPIGYEPFHWRK